MPSVFFKHWIWCFHLLIIYLCLIKLEKNIFYIIIMSIFSNSQKLSLYKYTRYLSMNITTRTTQTPRASLKFVTYNISWWNKTLSTALGFPENPTALTTFEQSPTQHCFYDDTRFVHPTIRKHTAPVYQKTFSILVVCMWT